MKLKAKKFGAVEGKDFRPGDVLDLSDPEGALKTYPGWFEAIEEQKETKAPEANKSMSASETKGGKRGK